MSTVGHSAPAVPPSSSSTENGKNHKKYRKDKPWDNEDIDHWAIQPWTADDNANVSALTEVSSFSVMFPKYREQYLREVWPHVTKALEKHGISCLLDLVEGSMSVSTTRKTRDPYIILKARDLLKLLARSVPFPQAIKILDDNMLCDILKIGKIIRNKERFIKRRQRLIGPNGNTLKALELLTETYLFVQGNTVAVMGGRQGIKIVSRIIFDCINNIHPIYHIKVLMIKRELAKDPALKEENWDRFLPKFKKKNVKTRVPLQTQKEREAAAVAATGTGTGTGTGTADADGEDAPIKPKKKEYTPFPPEMQQSKIDKQLESGEYFLRPKEIAARKIEERNERQIEAAVKREEKRNKAFEAPTEDADREDSAAAEVRERRDRKRKRQQDKDSSSSSSAAAPSSDASRSEIDALRAKFLKNKSESKPSASSAVVEGSDDDYLDSSSSKKKSKKEKKEKKDKKRRKAADSDNEDD
ncbi:hypothetical protein GQ42DRAFT_161945 [Ramicandelaber brevisporus]|nr:hypothetical protein GQ42DRAFT_161945 [Ramicandelaber brevisporus]